MSTIIKKFIDVSVKVRGFHFWEGAPDEVAFLRHEHRHLFGIRVRLLVDHADRAVEFFCMQRELLRILPEIYPQHEVDEFAFGGSSCEMIAYELYKSLTREGYNVAEICIDEDGENGGGIIATQHRSASK